MPNTDASPSVSIAALTGFCAAALRTTGVPSDKAERVATALATTDAMGVFTHGVKLLVGYLKKLRGGGYQPAAEPVVEREGPAWAVLDGQSSLGQVGCDAGLRIAMTKAAATGVAYVGVRNTGHIGAAGYFAAEAARRGFIAMITGNDMPSVAAPGSRTAVLGSNPLAYAIPTFGGDPILLDIATAAVAGGKVYAAHQRGEPIPPNWLIGPDGRPTTDGSLYPERASLAPMAGHKGYGLGLWCEFMSAVLPGGAATWQVGSWMFDDPEKPSLHNASLTLYHVETIAPRAEFMRRLQAIVDEIHSAATADGVHRVLLPGEREWTYYRRSQENGVALPADVWEKVRLAAALVEIPPPAGFTARSPS